MLIHDARITGSFIYNGVDISDITGSEASVNALNEFTSSYNTGSFTGSFTGDGSGLNNVVSASFATTATSSSFAATATSSSFASNATSSSFAANATSSSFATTALTSSFANDLTVAGTIVAQILNVQQVTSSIVYSSGSNQFGNSLGNVQQFTGSVSITGSLNVNGTSAVTGTGTTNYLPKFTGASTIGDSAVSDNGTTITLHSRALSATTATLSGAGSDRLIMTRTGIGTYHLAISGTNRFSIYDPSVDLERISIDSSGNLGLGVTPSAWRAGERALQIGATTSVTDISNFAVFRNNHYVNSSGQEIYITTNGASALVLAPNSEYRFLQAGVGTAGNAITFTQAMTLDASGNLIIGTTTPTGEKLQVNGTAGFSSNVTTGASFISTVTNGYGLILNRAAVTNYNGISHRTANSLKWFVGLRENLSSDNYIIYNETLSADVLTLNNSTGAATFSSNVGIGTTSPGMKLHVADVGGNISGGNAISTSTMKGIYLQNTNNGNESIGLWFNTGGSHWSGISGQRNDSASTWGTDLRFYTHENSQVDLTTARQRMIISSEGNVGIGTASPLGKLHSLSTTSNYAIVADNTLSGTQNFILFRAGANIGDIIRPSGTNDVRLNSNFGSIVFGTDGSGTAAERMRINNNGNVGIGTTSPAGILSIKGTTNNTVIEFDNGGASKAFMRSYDRTADAYKEFEILADYILLSTGSSPTERMRITSGGYVRLTSSSGGIQFNGDTAAANALNDYEEGTFTPGLTFGGGSTSMTFFDRAGVYTKIGRQVICTIYLALTAKGSSTGQALLTGLPFTNGNYNRGSSSAGSIRFDNITYSGSVQILVGASASSIMFEQVTEAGAESALTDSNFNSDTEMSITVTYFV